MVTARAVIDDRLCLVELDVEGHAGFSGAGEDLVCSSVSVLTRTAGRVILSQLKEYCGIRTGGKGSLDLKIFEIPEEKRGWMKGVTEFLLKGLSDLETDYPAFVKLEITINEEMIHGS